MVKKSREGIADGERGLRCQGKMMSGLGAGEEWWRHCGCADGEAERNAVEVETLSWSQVMQNRGI